MLIHMDLTHNQLTCSLTPTFTVGWNTQLVHEGVCQNQTIRKQALNKGSASECSYSWSESLVSIGAERSEYEKLHGPP